MKLKMLLLSAMLAPTVQAEPFFSEYLEGGSSNKALEIYNPADTPLNLTGYSVKVYSNGATSVGKTVTLTGTIPAKGTFVLYDTGSIQAIKDKGQLAIGTGNFNGDDAIALYKDALLLDVIGKIGERPVGGGWGSGLTSTLNKTLVRKASINQGDTDATDAFDPAAQWEGYAQDTVTYLGSHTADGGAPTDPTDPTDPEVPAGPQLGACAETATFISAVQGTGDVTPKAGQDVVVEAVVSRLTPFADGFYIQEETADQDTNAATSEAIFVYNNGATTYPTVGQKVRVLGKAEEYFTKTQIRRTGLLECGQAQAVTPVELTLPYANTAALESLEGMSVYLPQDLTVVDSYNFGTYGELSIAANRLFVPTNQFAPSSPEAIALAALNKRSTLVLDDLQSGKNPANVIYPAPGLSMNNPVRTGDTVSALSGVLDYSFSAWRILPEGQVQFTASNAREDLPRLRNLGTLKVASFNVLNYFNGDGLGGGFPTSRGATTSLEFSRQAEKTVAALTAVNADVVGLMEIENDGYGEQSAIVDLVGRLNAKLGAGTYQYVQVPGTTELGSDEITVGLLYKPSKVAPVGAAVTLNTGVFSFGNRQPLVQSFRQLSNNEVFTFAVNHFKSKGSCPSGTTNPDRDLKDGQGCWTATRVQAANELTSWLATKPTGTADADVLIMGDLNAYAKETPITTLVNKGFVNLVEKYQGNHGYSYVFGGEAGYLDHALASTSLSTQAVYAMEWHINADETTLFDYNTELKTPQQVVDFYQPSPFRASDHDPVVVELDLKTRSPADLDLDGDVDANDVNLFNAKLKSGVRLGLEYDFNKDGVVSALDARAMTAMCTYARCAIK
ncbi:MAG: ExeM/NucH family extracellular endonuclease [Gammaproteobacteria bacterium]|nr:ExeM/NucH family extracellular endonuclease [Gammaproteobacteria bacterium]